MGGFKKITVKVRKSIPTEWNKDDKGKDIKKEPITFKTVWDEYGFNLYQLNHWRGFTGQDEQGTPGIFTIIYLNGNQKGLTLGINRENFEKAIAEQTAGDDAAQQKFQVMLAEIFTMMHNIREAEDKRARLEQHDADLIAQEEE